MGLFRTHKLSLIRHIKALGNGFSPPVPTFVDLDAHANMDTLPKTDFVGLAAFSMAVGDREVEVFASYVCSTWGDADIMRLTDMVDVVTDALLPEKQVPLWLANPGPGVEPSWMVVSGTETIEPTERTDQRAMQAVTVRLLSSRTV